MRRLRSSPCLLPLIILLIALAAGLTSPGAAGQSRASDEEIRQSLQTFTRVFELVESNSAEPLDADKAIYKGAIPSMLKTLDPHSNFFDPRDFRLLREDQNGRYFGVGMMVGGQNGKVTVMHPFSGSPAYKAGIRPGDLISHVDGKSTDGLTLTHVVDMLKGPRGTRVRVTVNRPGAEQPLNFEMTREEIARKSVTHAYMVRPGIAYVHIESFNENTSRELDQAMRKLGEKDLEGLILDLRGNPGGLLNEGVAVAERFLRKGQTVVSHRGRSSPERPYVAGRGAAGGREYPVVVMVNKYSASAAEIVAGALQDHDRAWIFGESTFGKGLVQSQFPLSEDTALLLTTARYYTPSGRLIQRDYAGVSFFEYYNRKEAAAAGNGDVRSTDSGRKVVGGGGITPDEKFSPPKLNAFQSRLLGRAAFFEFASNYFGGREARLPRDWKPDAGILEQFRSHLRAKEIRYTEAEFTANQKFIEEQLRLEMYTIAFSKEDADRLAVEMDPAVEKAIEALPKAKALAGKARELIVRRTAARAGVQR